MGQAASAGSLEAVYQTALRCVQDELGVERASLLLFDAERTMRFVAWSGLSEEYRSAVDGHSPWSPDETNATPLRVPDVERDTALASYLPVFRREGICALAFVPVQFGPKLLGKFMLYYRQPHTFSDVETATAQHIANQVALALEHHRLSVALNEQLVTEREIRQRAETEAVQRQASESRLHLALAAGRMGTWDWDIASDRVGWSAELEFIHGLEPGTFGGTFDAFRRDMHPADVGRLERAIAAALEAPEAEYNVEYRIVREDGACRWLEARGRVIIDSEGRPTRMVGVCRDTTERRRAEEARALLVGQLETLAKVSDEIAGTLDPNEALRQLASRVVPTFADYCVTYVADEGSIHPLGCAHRDPAKSALVAALAHASPVSVEDRWGPGMVIRRGEPCLTTHCSIKEAEALAPRSMMIVPLNARSRTLGAIAFAATDDSGRRFGDEDLKIGMALASRTALLVDNARLYAEARSAIRARDDTIAVVSHDLRDPLQSIAAAVATLQLEPDDAGKAEGIQSITFASTQMRLLVQDLLDISQIDAGRFSISKDKVDLTALVKEAQTLFQPQAEAKAVRLECQLAADLPPVAADRHRVLQVLLNLIGNALKFVPAGSAITLGAEPDGDAVRVWVADTGIGIADDHLAKVFERFWRADRREGGGVGLGLAVAKAIVEAHGGRIGVTSRLGAGSTFHFTLHVHLAAADSWRAAGDRVVVADGAAQAETARPRPSSEVAVVNVLWDITERKRAENAVREADRHRDEFLATLAHELRNPLAALRAGVAVVGMASGDPETVVEHCTLMERQLQQLARLVDDLLDMSHLTQRRLSLEKGRIELAAVVRTAVEQSRILAEQADHELSVRLPDERIVLDADPQRLGLVLTHLLSNAVKYTPRGGHIELAAERAGAGVRVSVRDNGLGIPPDKLETIFEIFGRVDRSLETGYKGLGIGLALVNALVKMHGGTIEARSEGLGKGSVFNVWLPIAVETAAPHAPGEAAGVRRTGNCRVLLVDDDQDVARSMARFIRLLGHDIRVAFDGVEAVEMAGEFKPDVVLMDIGLPKVNGYDVAREMRSKPWGEKMILVAVTGWGRESDRRRSHEAGFDRHLTKPMEPDMLEALLNSCSSRAVAEPERQEGRV